MITYICDSCKGIIANPYEVNMKEFYIGYFIGDHGPCPTNEKRKRKIHLCDECFKCLREVALNANNNIPSENQT